MVTERRLRVFGYIARNAPSDKDQLSLTNPRDALPIMANVQVQDA